MQPQRRIYHPMSNTRGERWEDKRERHHPASKVTTEMSQLITNTIYRSGISTTVQFQERKGEKMTSGVKHCNHGGEAGGHARGSNATSKGQK